jgi:hypothetical protein
MSSTLALSAVELFDYELYLTGASTRSSVSIGMVSDVAAASPGTISREGDTEINYKIHIAQCKRRPKSIHAPSRSCRLLA